MLDTPVALIPSLVITVAASDVVLPFSAVPAIDVNPVVPDLAVTVTTAQSDVMLLQHFLQMMR
ncbi:MAG: hypothetical protein ACOXZP_01405 [Minisyncoccales bacterium]